MDRGFVHQTTKQVQKTTDIVVPEFRYLVINIVKNLIENSKYFLFSNLNSRKINLNHNLGLKKNS